MLLLIQSFQLSCYKFTKDLTFAFFFLSWCQFINNMKCFKLFFFNFGFFTLSNFQFCFFYFPVNLGFRNGVFCFSAISFVPFFREFSNSFASYWSSSLYPSLLPSSLFSSSLFCSSSYWSSSKAFSPPSFAKERFDFVLRTFTNGNSQLS